MPFHRRPPLHGRCTCRPSKRGSGRGRAPPAARRLPMRRARRAQTGAMLMHVDIAMAGAERVDDLRDLWLAPAPPPPSGERAAAGTTRSSGTIAAPATCDGCPLLLIADAH